MSFFEAALYLENGHLFEGKGFGRVSSEKSIRGLSHSDLHAQLPPLP